MKFSAVAVLAVVAPMAAGFATTSNQRQLSVGSNVAFMPQSRASSTMRGAMSMELSDLEKKLLDPKPEQKKGGAKPAKEEKPKPEKKQKAKKEEPAPAPAPVPAPEPVKATKGKKAKTATYDLGGVEGKPKPAKKQPSPFAEKPKIQPKPAVPKAPKAPKAPKPAPVAKAPAEKDPNAVPAGVALGAAPLLLAPVALLGAGRGALQGTKARREKIQTEIAQFEAAKAKKAVNTEVDGGGVVTALVSVPFCLSFADHLASVDASHNRIFAFFFDRDFWELLLRRWR